MNKWALPLALILLARCKTAQVGDSQTSAIQQAIRSFSVSAHCDDACVKEMEFLSQTVYVFEQGTCGMDMENEVLDEKGGQLGTLGGISGNTHIAGADFSEARLKKVVWRKAEESAQH